MQFSMSNIHINYRGFGIKKFSAASINLYMHIRNVHTLVCYQAHDP